MKRTNRKPTKPTKGPLKSELVGKLRELIQREGEAAAADFLQISGPTLGRASGGLGIGPGTRALIELQLARIDRGGTTT